MEITLLGFQHSLWVAVLKLNEDQDWKPQWLRFKIIENRAHKPCWLSYQMSTKRLIYSCYTWCRGAAMNYGPIQQTLVTLHFSFIPIPPCVHWKTAIHLLKANTPAVWFTDQLSDTQLTGFWSDPDSGSSHNQTLTGRPSFKICLGRTTFSLNREHFIPVCSSLFLASWFSLLFCEFEPNPVSNSNSVNSKGLVLHFYKVRGRDIQTFSL